MKRFHKEIWLKNDLKNSKNLEWTFGRYPDYSKNGTSFKAFINKFQNIIKTIFGKKDPHS